MNGFSESGILSAWVLLLFGWGGLTADDVWIYNIFCIQNNLCEFTLLEHKFKKGILYTKKEILTFVLKFSGIKYKCGSKIFIQPKIQIINSDKGPLFLEFNSKMKLSDQLINLRKILKIGGFIVWIAS